MSCTFNENSEILLGRLFFKKRRNNLQLSEVMTLYYHDEIIVKCSKISWTEIFGKVNTATVTIIHCSEKTLH